MRLVLDSDPTLHTVRGYGDGEVLVGERRLTAPCILSAARLIEEWSVRAPAQLDTAALAPLLELAPAIILLGYGEHHAPPPRAPLRELQRRGIATEVMNLGAACRTYNVLVHDGRAVVAALFP